MRTYDRSHKKLEVKVGQAVRLVLPAQATAGYVWKPEPVEGLAVPDAPAGQSASPAAVGASTSQEFIVSARRPGTYSLRFTYGRAWEKSPEDTAEFTVVVSGR